MTFSEIVGAVQARLNLSSTESATRIGVTVNDFYKQLTSSLGINVVRRSTVSATVTLGVTTVTFTGVEKLVNVVDRSTTPYRVLKEITIEELRQRQPSANGFASYYCIVDYDATTVTIEMDCIPQTAFDLYADGFITLSTLSGSNVPAFPESFHDILVDGALTNEYLKMEKASLASIQKTRYEARLSDLRMWIAKSSYLDIHHGKSRGRSQVSGVPGAGSGGSAVDGSSSYTQTGLITFDRDPSAPFAVTASSAVVPNLDADLLDGQHGTYYRTPANFIGPSDATKFLNGAATPAFALVKDSDLSTSDITTNDVTASKHGFAPKGANTGVKFLRDDATWATPKYSIASTSTSTGAQNNWAPGLVTGAHTYIPWAGASDAAITGISGGVAGQVVTIRNSSSSKVITFAHQSGSSSAGNKFRNIVTSGVTPVALGGYITFCYDGTDWVLVAHNQGAPIDVAHSDANFTGDATDGNWVVASGDQVQFRYVVEGKFLTVILTVATSTVANTPTELRTTIPASYVATGTINLPTYVSDNGTGRIARVYTIASATTMNTLLLSGNFANATDATTVSYTFRFEIN